MGRSQQKFLDTDVFPAAFRDVPKVELWALIEITMCTVLVIALLSNSILGPGTPLAVFGFVAVFVLIKPWAVPHVLQSSWPLLLLPCLAAVSAVWSLDPGASTKYGLYFLITVTAGVILGAGFRPTNLLKGLCLGLFLASLLGFVLGQTVTIGADGEAAFSGIQGSKNAAGSAAGVAVLVSMAMVNFAWRGRQIGWLALGLAGLLLGAATLVLSKATGALISGCLAFVCLNLWLVSRRMHRQARVGIFVFAILVLVIIGATSNYWFDPLFDIIIKSSGKDAGLTGRDLIWQKADSLIAERPWFGMGYNAFWVESNADARMIWDAMGILSHKGFNFHNTFKEILVSIGYVGLGTYVITVLVTSAVLLVRTMIAPNVHLILASALLVYFYFKFPVETFGFGGMDLLGMLVYTVLTMGFSATIGRRAAAPTE